MGKWQVYARWCFFIVLIRPACACFASGSPSDLSCTNSFVSIAFSMNRWIEFPLQSHMPHNLQRGYAVIDHLQYMIVAAIKQCQRLRCCQNEYVWIVQYYPRLPRATWFKMQNSLDWSSSLSSPVCVSKNMFTNLMLKSLAFDLDFVGRCGATGVWDRCPEL